MQGNLPWILGLLFAIAYFALFEILGFVKPNKFNTLSHVVYTTGLHWPLAIWIMGVFCGGLATHFFWHWCPAGSVSTGMLLLFGIA